MASDTDTERVRAREPNKGGRPTKLTSEVHDKIVMAIRSGNYQETASQYAGIDPSTFYDWIKWGREQKSPKYIAFAEAVERASAEAEVAAVAVIRMGSPSWQSRAWWLERRFPKRWGRGPWRDDDGESKEILPDSVYE